MTAAPRILFFARGYQVSFYPELAPTCDDAPFEPVYVTLTREEADQVRAKGHNVAACFEDDFDAITPAPVPHGYLLTSFTSDRFLGRFSHEERMTILGKEIAFWRGLFDRFNPVAVCNELVAIEISEVLVIEARARGVRYLAPMYCPIEGYFYWLPDPLTLSGQRLNLPQPTPTSLAVADTYLDEVRRSDYKPYYVRNLASRRAIKPLATGLAKSALWRWRDRRSRDPVEPGAFRYESYSEEYGKRPQVFAASILHDYDDLSAIPQEHEIVLYPLHQEPEATLNYMSEFCANQVATIENILKCLTPSQRLVVKEHPVDKGALLRPKFRDLRARHSNLAFLPAEVPAREILARCERVVTLTSSVGWEAAILGKSVCVMGEIFWDSVPGVIRITDWPELRRVLRTPLEELGRVALEDARRFVAGLLQISHRGRPLPNTALYDPGNIAQVREAIVQGAGLKSRSVAESVEA